MHGMQYLEHDAVQCRHCRYKCAYRRFIFRRRWRDERTLKMMMLAVTSTYVLSSHGIGITEEYRPSERRHFEERHAGGRRTAARPYRNIIKRSSNRPTA